MLINVKSAFIWVNLILYCALNWKKTKQQQKMTTIIRRHPPLRLSLRRQTLALLPLILCYLT